MLLERHSPETQSLFFYFFIGAFIYYATGAEMIHINKILGSFKKVPIKMKGKGNVLNHIQGIANVSSIIVCIYIYIYYNFFPGKSI